MPSIDADFIIVGAGLAGLSFAFRLLPILKEQQKSLIIVDKKNNFEQDKHWCGWSINKHPFEHLIKNRYKSLSVGKANHIKTYPLESITYQMIASSDFYTYCLSILNSDYRVELKLGQQVENIFPNYIQCREGPIYAKWVIDATNPQAGSVNINDNAKALLQCFYGWTIRSQNPVFNVNHANFMEFAEDQSEGILFNYLLPIDEYTALIEPTYFLHHTKIPSKEYFFKIACQYLNDTFSLKHFDVLGVEQGVLPMAHISSKSPNGVLQIGTNAGLLRPSTGYAFDGIQQHQDTLINFYKQYGTFKRITPYRAHTIWMDKIFLKVLNQNPSVGSNVFEALFKNTDTKRIIRFMSDKGTLQDCLSVILGVPKWPFIKALFT